MKKNIRKTTVSSIFSALIVVLILLGSFIDILDITVAAICTLAVYIIQIEIGGKYPLLVYITSSILCLIFVPMTTATLYYVAFFGYYPILKKLMSKLPKIVRKAVCLLFFNMIMILLMILFRTVFALQNEPIELYAVLLISINIFFICFDYMLDLFYFIYIKKLKKFINLKL